MAPIFQNYNLDKLSQSITHSVTNLEDLFCNAEIQTKSLLDNMKTVKCKAQLALKKFQCIVDNLDLIIEGNEQTLDMLKISAKKFKVSEEDCVKQNIISVTNTNRNNEKPYSTLPSVENLTHSNIIKCRRRLSSGSAFGSSNLSLSPPKTDKREHKKNGTSMNKDNLDVKRDMLIDSITFEPSPVKTVEDAKAMNNTEQSLNELFKELRDGKVDKVECMSIMSEETLQLEITDPAYTTMEL